MITIVPIGIGDIFSVSVRGQQPVAEFGALGLEFGSRYAGPHRLRVLFDWADLEGWDNAASVEIAFRPWVEAAPHMQRVAIVHRHCWDRQAAYLAAIFRVRAVQVRSLCPSRRQLGLDWLKEEPRTARAQHAGDR